MELLRKCDRSRLFIAMDTPPNQTLDYASPAPTAARRSSGGRWALLLGGASLLLVPCMLLSERTTFPAFLGISVLALCTLVSGIRGLMNTRYRFRSIFGLIFAGAAMFGGIAMFGF